MSIFGYPNILAIGILILTLLLSYLISKISGRVYIFSRFQEILFFFMIAFALKAILYFNLPVTFINVRSMAEGMILFAITTCVVKAIIILFIGAIFPKSKFQAAIILERILYFLYFMISVALLLGYVFDMRLGALLTTSAILTGVAGFAAKDVITALLKSILISFESALNLGDWVQIEDKVGKVIEISIHRLKIQGEKGEVIVYPIKQMFENRVINFSANKKYIRCSIDIGTSYDNPPQKVKAVLNDLLSGFSGVLKEPSPVIRLTSYGDFAINYKILFAIQDFGQRWEIKNLINTAIWGKFQQEGIKIPYPIMDVNINRPAEGTQPAKNNYPSSAT